MPPAFYCSVKISWTASKETRREKNVNLPLDKPGKKPEKASSSLKYIKMNCS
jgi:hypothetical protein